MKKIVLNLILLIVISGLSSNVFAQKQKVILDTDLGGDIDDAYALALLISSPELEILGVVMDQGNTPKRARIACQMLYETGRENIPVVIGRKTNETYYNQFYWSEGFIKTQPVKQSGADFIIEQLKKYPNEVILITIGPVPNMGDILDKEPGALKLAKHVYSMFGSFYIGHGSNPIPSNEYNVRRDVAPQTEMKSVFRGRYQRDGYSVEMYALNGEGDYIIPLLVFVPKTESKFSSVIYLNPKGKISDASIGGRIEQLVKKGYLVAAPDVIGTGETEGSSNVAMLIGRSIVGIQAGDEVRVVNFLKSRKDVDINKIGAIAFDEICPVLLHATTIDKSINSISLIGSLISFWSIVMNKFYDRSFSNYAVAGALTAYDLPDLIGCTAPRKIALVELKGQMKQPASKELIDEELSFPRSVYSLKMLQRT